MKTNEYQIGGNHYKDFEYQHWDFAIDAVLNYIDGCSTKYVTRWRNKNGIEDLEKAIHYIDKAMSLPVRLKSNNSSILNRFCAQLPNEEGFIVQLIVEGEYQHAKRKIGELIFSEPTSAYVNQD